MHHRGSAPTINSLLSGAVDFAMDNTTSITQHARAGSVRAVGITTLRRWPLGQEYVPIAETLPGYEALGFTGLAVRAGTPREICNAIETAAVAIARQPVFRERMAGMLAEVVGTGSAAFGVFLAAERAKWGKLITELNIRVG